MDLSTVNMILVLAATWKGSAKHGDIPIAYVKTDKEAHLEIDLQLPRGMDVDDRTLEDLAARSRDTCCCSC